MNIVTMDEVGRVKRVETVAENAPVNSPLDLGFGPDGALYILNYGSAWYSANNDSGLIQIEFNGTRNRAPKVVANADRSAGGTPLTLNVSAEGSFDPEGDEIAIEWSVIPTERGIELNDLGTLFQTPEATGVTARLTVDEAGSYVVIARARDEEGAFGYAAIEIEAGNEPPTIDIAFDGNQSFYWPGRGLVDYEVIVTDAEDGSSLQDPAVQQRISARTRASELTKPVDDVIGHLKNPPMNAAALLSENNCTTCHQTDADSIGPSYRDVAFHYAERADANAYLDQVLINGGAGVWGEHQMPAHDYLEENVRAIMIDYVLGLHDGAAPLPVKGQIDFSSLATDLQLLELKASYTDQGSAEAPSLETTESHILVPSELRLEVYAPNQGAVDGVNKVWADQNRRGVGLKANGSFVHLGRFDVTNVRSVMAHILDGRQHMIGSVRLELRIGAPDGDVFASDEVRLNSNPQDQWQLSPNVLDVSQERVGFEDLYLVAHPATEADHIGIFSLEFEFE